MAECPKVVRVLMEALADAWDERFDEEEGIPSVMVDSYAAVIWDAAEGRCCTPGILYFPAMDPSIPNADGFHPSQYWAITEDELREMVNNPGSIPASVTARPLLEN